MYDKIVTLYDYNTKTSRGNAYKLFCSMVKWRNSNIYKKYQKLMEEDLVASDFIIVMSDYIENNKESFKKKDFFHMLRLQLLKTYRVERGLFAEKHRVRAPNGSKDVQRYHHVEDALGWLKKDEWSGSNTTEQEYNVLYGQLKDFLVKRFGLEQFEMFENHFIHNEPCDHISYFLDRKIGPGRVRQICDKIRDKAQWFMTREMGSFLSHDRKKHGSN